MSPWKGEVPRVYDMTCDDTVCPPDSFCLSDYDSGGSRCHCNLGRRGDICSEGTGFSKSAAMRQLSTMWLLLQFVHLQTYIHHDLMLCFFSGTGELSQILWPLSHDFWTLEELLPDLSDHFGVQGKATFPTGLHISKAWKELWNGFSVVQADSEDGLLLYCGENEHGRGDFTSLALVRSKLHYRWRKPWLTYQLRFWKVWLVDKNGKMCFMSARKQECTGEHRGW